MGSHTPPLDLLFDDMQSLPESFTAANLDGASVSGAYGITASTSPRPNLDPSSIPPRRTVPLPSDEGVVNYVLSPKRTNRTQIEWIPTDGPEAFLGIVGRGFGELNATKPEVDTLTIRIECEGSAIHGTEMEVHATSGRDAIRVQDVLLAVNHRCTEYSSTLNGIRLGKWRGLRATGPKTALLTLEL